MPVVSQTHSNPRQKAMYSSLSILTPYPLPNQARSESNLDLLNEILAFCVIPLESIQFDVVSLDASHLFEVTVVVDLNESSEFHLSSPKVEF